jgi:hypothetical protein
LDPDLKVGLLTCIKLAIYLRQIIAGRNGELQLRKKMGVGADILVEETIEMLVGEHCTEIGDGDRGGFERRECPRSSSGADIEDKRCTRCTGERRGVVRIR